jgi:hypothetical protein
MNIKINLPLINKISALFSRGGTQVTKRREDTTETSIDISVVSYYYKKVKLERTRKAKYGDYNVMDEEYPEVSTCLDLYADNATKDRNEDGDVIGIKTENSKVTNIIGELIDRLKLQQTLCDTARNIAKMGDDFDEVVIDDRKLIVILK